MTDIVERLRAVSNKAYKNIYGDMVASTTPGCLNEAADEIERLRKEAWECFETNGDLALLISEKDVEIKQLRAALEPMVEHFNVGGGKVPIGKMLEDARRALATGESDPT